MAYENVIYEKTGHVCFVTLNNPESMNAVCPVLMADMLAAMHEADNDSDVRAVVLKGAGASFCAGGNLATLPSPEPAPGRPPILDIAVDRHVQREAIEGWLSLWQITKPIIAQVHGYCLTGGTILATLCDIIVVAEDARISPTPLAGPLGAGLAAATWSWAIGPRKASELCFRIGYYMSGKEAAEIGWANRAAPPSELAQAVRQFTDRIVQVPPEIIALEKTAIVRMQETLGLRAAVLIGAEMNTIGHYTYPVLEFTNRVREVGFKQASAEWKQTAGLEAHPVHVKM